MPAVALWRVVESGPDGEELAERPAILRALALLPRRRDERAPRLPGAASGRARSGDEAERGR
jgi:hypothetical protein